ncbi:DUF3164 family protein [Chromobacterium vaccinii]|uniref:DUF3164 family protein n=1 Tax=Chromobacterium vaccinii TaxID=1108595 RepID=UPI0031DBC0FD
MSDYDSSKYRVDAKGRLVPLDHIGPIDLQRDELVVELVTKAKGINQGLAEFRDQAFGDIEAFLALAAERHNVNLGGAKGNITMYSFDGRYKLQRQIRDRITFDEGVQIAKTIVDECLREWSAESRSELQAVVAGAFDVDKEGKISVRRLLDLMRLSITDERWKQGMTILRASMRSQDSKAYVRFYEREDKNGGQYLPISLDISNA